MESKNGIRTWYIYGVTGIEGMVLEDGSNNTITYFFDKNTLGDVVAIRDVRGYIVGTYEYDAWGNVTSQTGDISEINPFRYRGYYYDDETGFYYLQTRYYDPTICRFINADNYELIPELSSVAGQLNLYAYANNNPIMLTDESGEGILTTMLIGALIGGALSAGIDVANQLRENGTINLMQTGLSFLGGALSGAVAASSLGISWQIGINTGIGMLLNVAGQTSGGQEFNVVSMVNDGLSGGLAGLSGGKGVYKVGNQLIGAFEYGQLTISNVKALAELNNALKNSTITSVSVLMLKILLGA